MKTLDRRLCWAKTQTVGVVPDQLFSIQMKTLEGLLLSVGEYKLEPWIVDDCALVPI